MVYASSKAALSRTLIGIGAEVQGSDFSEVAEDVGALIKFYSFLGSRIDVFLVHSAREAQAPLVLAARFASCHSIDTLPFHFE